MIPQYTIEKMRAIYLPNMQHSSSSTTNNSSQAVCSINTELMSLGYILNRNAYEKMCSYDGDMLQIIRNVTIDCIREIVGANETFEPFYPNFPQQVMDASDTELFVNAMMHYWTAGEWVPIYPKQVTKKSMERGTYVPLSIVDEKDLQDRVQTLMSAKDSLPNDDVKFITHYLSIYPGTQIPSIPFKENACVVAGTILRNSDCDISAVIKTTKDVLRLATYLSNGDHTLVIRPRFKSFKRSMRKRLLAILEQVIQVEDIQRDAGWWVKLFHSLHVGDYASQFPKCYKSASNIRNNIRVVTFNGRLQQAYLDNNIDDVLVLAVQRPGIFARNLGAYLRKFPDKGNAINAVFATIVDDIPTRNLLSLWGFLKSANNMSTTMLIPGRRGELKMEPCTRNDIPVSTSHLFINTIRQSLIRRFAEKDKLGNVYIEPTMYSSVVPTSMRSAPKGKLTVARGTRLPMDSKNFIRLFCFWDNKYDRVDLDLSASFLSESFSLVNHCCFRSLRVNNHTDNKPFSVHSGDVISSGPKGAVEFIDIDRALTLQAGARYVIMTVMYYNSCDSTENFDTINNCFMGWMSRADQHTGSLFDPKTIQQKVDVVGNGVTCIPVIFDLVENVAIWTNFQNMCDAHSGTSVFSHEGVQSELLRGTINNTGKVSLGELYDCHVTARGTMVDDIDNADTVFTSFPNGNANCVTPFNYDTILTEYF